VEEWTLGVILGFLYANFLDWSIHILLHKPRGRSKLKFHWKHHKIARKHNNLDPDYSKKIFHNETWLTLAGILLHTPLLFIFPYFASTIILYALIYIFLHRLSHTYVAFFKKWMPWHYEHHMGKDQNSNWCVICPLMDHIMRTRKKWLQTN